MKKYRLPIIFSSAPFACLALVMIGFTSGLLAADPYTLLGSWTAPVPVSNERIGSSVALGEDWIALGGNANKVHLLHSPSRTFARTITADTGASGFGRRIAIAGDSVIIAESTFRNKTHIYNAESGSLIRTLGHPAESIAVSGDMVMLGSGSGSVRLYSLSSGNLLGTLSEPGGQTGGQFGRAVAIDDQYLIVGAPYAEISRGAVHLFDRTTFGYVRTITPDTASTGDLFGFSLSVENGKLLTGTPGFWLPSGEAEHGCAYLHDTETGEQIARYIPFGEWTSSSSPGTMNSVVLSGSIAFLNVGNQDSGRGAIYAIDTATGREIYRMLAPLPRSFSDNFGQSLAVLDNMAVTASPGKMVGAESRAGEAYFHTVTGNEDPINEMTTLNRRVVESEGTVEVEIRLRRPADSDITVDYNMQDNSWGAFQTPPAAVLETGTVTIPTGSDRAVVSLAISDQPEPERSASFYLRLINPVGAALRKDLALVTVYDDDSLLSAPLQVKHGLLPTALSESAHFGSDVALSGVTPVVGAIRDTISGADRGAAYMFDEETGAQTSLLLPQPEGTSQLFFGELAADGDGILVGSSGGARGRGSAYLFDASGNLVRQFVGSQVADDHRFGSEVAMSATHLLVGASSASVNGDYIGAAYLFDRQTGAELRIFSPNVAPGNHFFGSAVALTESHAIVGASGENGGNSNNGGKVYVFSLADGSLVHKISSPTSPAEGYGTSVAADGNLMAVSNPSGQSNYRVDVFNLTTGGFVRSIPGGGAYDYFGRSMAMDGDTLAVGAPGFIYSAGRVDIFNASTGTLLQSIEPQGTLKNGSNFGSSVAIMDNRVVIGASGSDNYSGQAFLYTLAGGVQNLVPVAVGSFEILNGQTGSVSLDGSGSSDPDGNIISYAWAWDGGSASGANPTVTLPIAGTTVTLTVTDNAGATGQFDFLVTFPTPMEIAQQAYLKAGNTGAGDQFGYSVAVSGDTVVVGAYLEDSGTTGVNSTPNEGATDSGAAYVFVRDGNEWSQQAYLKASNTGAGDAFGYSVAVSGDTVVIGAHGEDSNAGGVNGDGGNNSATHSGAAYVFARNGGTWSQQAYLKAGNPEAGDLFGNSVAVSGDTVVVGAYLEDSGTTGVNSTPNESLGDSGAAYVFVHDGSDWSQQAYLKAGNAGLSDWFGHTVAVSGDTVVVGAHREGSSTSGVNSTPNDDLFEAGAAYVFVRSGSDWSQQAYLKAGNTRNGDQFGYSVAVSGDTVAVGSPLEDSGTSGVNSTPSYLLANSGAAYVFVRDGSDWSQQAYLKASNPGFTELFGTSVAVSGDMVVVGAHFEDSGTTGINSAPDESAPDSGAAYVFVRNVTTWSQQAYLKAGNAGAFDEFGRAVAVSGDTVLLGAPLEASGTSGVNTMPDEEAIASGAAYIFTGFDPNLGNQAPIAAADFQIINVETGEVTLDADGSSDPDGNIVSYEWTWAGGSASGALTSGNFPVGSTLVTLTVTDDDGASSTDTVTIHISNPSPSSDFTYTSNGIQITITGYTGAGGAVTIPETIDGLPVRVIGNNAFLNKTNLTSVTLPGSVASIGTSAFQGCTGLTSVNLQAGLAIIGISAFRSCAQLTSINIPSGVTNIGGNAFTSCVALTSVSIPESVTSIGISAFSSCFALAEITLPGGLASIPSGLFQSCTSLTQITIPVGVTSIGSTAFNSCTALTGIIIPVSVTSIGAGAFQSCSALANLILSDSLNSIGNNAFRSCAALQAIVIPANVTSMGNGAFQLCSALTGAVFLGDAPSMGTAVFDGTAGGFTVFFNGVSTGFTTPTWLGYASVALGDPAPAAPSIISQPSGQTITSGTTATIFVAATGTPLPSYQWYQGGSGDTSNLIPGATNASFTTPALTSATSYWVRASNSEGMADSDTAQILIAAPSANLANLTVSEGSLSPGFNKLNLPYTVNVANSVSSIQVTPTVEGAGATVKVNAATVSSGTASNPVNLAEGQNTISVEVTSADLALTKTYTVTVNRAGLPAITTDAATDINDSGAILRGTVVPNGTAQVFFEYGPTPSYGTTTPSQFLSGNNAVAFQSTISGLLGATTIHYRAVAVSGGVSIFGEDRSFTTLPPPVVVVTGNPVIPAASQATLVGAVNTRGLAVDVRFEYGTTMAFGNTTPVRSIPAGSGIQDVFEDVTGLIQDADYFVRLVATTPDAITGNTVAFKVVVGGTTTTGSPTDVPSAITGEAVDVENNSGTMRGTVNSKGGTTTAFFQYGTSPSFGQTTTPRAVGNDTLDAEVSIPVTNLLPGTRYFYRILAENSLGASVPGATEFFDTDFDAPVVTTGIAEALSTTSVRIPGTVRARNADTTVDILFGTNPAALSSGVSATPDMLSGDSVVNVLADIDDLLQSVTYFYQVRAVNSGGTTLGPLRSFRVTTLSGLLQVFPDALPAGDHLGTLQVNLSPNGAGGGWRLAGEQPWRLSGETISGLANGDRLVEYRAVSGFIQPSSETVALVSGAPPSVLNRTYTASGATGSGSITVNLKPDSFADPSRPVATRAQWRLLGETDSDWRNSGVTLGGLVPGNHVIECKPIAGRSTPPPSSVLVGNGDVTEIVLTYFESDQEVGASPQVLAFDSVSASQAVPYGFVGQIRSDIGSATGFVVRPRVVATVAHSVFDDGTLAAVTGLQWLFQRHRNVHEPAPQIPRGFYTMTGYAARRAIDNSPGISSPESQHLDAAAMFFAEEAGRAGFSGYVASDLDENEFLLSPNLKTLVGYPVENISATDRDRMHATPPANISFTRPAGQTRVFATQDVRSTGGHSGGPLCVLAPNGKFYPAAIYLGGTGQTLVRAIDSDVATLFGFAEVSANSIGSGGRGSITDSQSSPVGTPALGSLKVIIEPAGARNAGAGWRIGAGSYLASGAQIDNLAPNSYGIEFPTVPGFEAPATPSVEIVAGELNTVTFTYEIIIPPPVINSPTSVTLNKNEELLYETTATNSPDMFSLSGLLPLGTVFDPATGRITGVLQEAGRFPVVVGVSNPGGTDTRAVEIISLPLISPQTVNAPFLEEFTYQIASSESGGGAEFTISNLPPGLSMDAETGIVSGIPTTPGTYVAPVSVSRFGAGKSSAVTFEIVGTSPSITQQPAANLTVEYGQSVTLSIETDGLPTPSVQWYRGASGDTSLPVAGATANTFVSPPLTSSTGFWARVTNLSGSADSETSLIQVLASNNANLAFLSLNAAAISPSFNANTTSYTANVPNSVSSITLTPIPDVPVSTVTINGNPSPNGQPSDPAALSVGQNIVSLVVTAQDGTTTKTYTLTVTRAPAPLVITLGSDGIDDISATIRGSVNPNGSGTAFFEYGPTTSYGSRTSFQQVSGTSAIPVSAALTALSGNRTYHYRVALSDGGTPVFGNDMTFTTGPDRPLVATGNAAGISETGATLIGIVNPRGTSTDVHFEYGTNPALLGNTTPAQNIGAGTGVLEVTAPSTGLNAGVIYYYRAVASSAAVSLPVLGEIKQFTAQITTEVGDGLADAPPIILPGTEVASDILADSAVLTATINPNDGSTLVFFEYGTTPAYGFQSEAFRIGNGTQNALVTLPVSNLQTGVTYFFRAVAENARGVTNGNGGSFSTSFDAPVVVTGEALPISTRSARVTGTVQANGTTRDVYFQYGTDGVTFPQSVRAFQQSVGGNIATPVFVDLVNLDEGVTYFYKLVATDVGEADGTDGEVLSLNASILFGLVRQDANDVPLAQRDGQLTVNLLPNGMGNWRFRGEQAWRASGETATALGAGDRHIEFRPVTGFIQPPSELVSLVNGEPATALERNYYASGSSGTSSVAVNLFPAQAVDDGAQWRLAGDEDTEWKDSGQSAAGLMPGTYLIEAKAIPGRDKPALASVTVTTGGTRTISIAYLETPAPIASPPAPVAFAPGSGGFPSHVGQIRSDSASFSGFAVKPRVVATVAQAVFDDATLSTVTGLQWLLQRDREDHEPKPQTPRGTYLFVGYDAQRLAENTPGVLSIASQNFNAASLYFFEDIGRGGFSGYLGSDEESHPFLVSSASKTLVGYPLGGKMHATAPGTAAYSLVQEKTYQSATIRGFNGMQGCPLFAQHTNGSFYPAAIHLGGASSGLVRAIDSDVIDLFTRAEVSGNGGDNNVGGGITHTSVTGNLNVTQTGALRVNIEPAGAVALGAAWQLLPEAVQRQGGTQKSGLSPGTYDVAFRNVTGFAAPSNASVTVSGGQLTIITFTYGEGFSDLDLWRFGNFETHSNTGDAADDADPDKDGKTNLEEFTAGTNPNDNADFFDITTATKSGNTFTATCAGKAGRTYRLMRNTTLSGVWTTVETRAALASDQAITLTDPAAPNDNAFYRIEVMMP